MFSDFSLTEGRYWHNTYTNSQGQTVPAGSFDFVTVSHHALSSEGEPFFRCVRIGDWAEAAGTN